MSCEISVDVRRRRERRKGRMIEIRENILSSFSFLVSFHYSVKNVFSTLAGFKTGFNNVIIPF